MRFFNVIFIIFAILAMSLCVSGAEIGRITFVQDSDYKFPDQMLFFNIQQKVGAQFDERLLNEDIKRLYSTGFFTDVVSETTVDNEGKIDITLKVTPRPRIKAITFEGNKKFDNEKLDKEITLVADQPLSDAKLRESTSKLRKFYMSEGFNDATITPQVKEVEKGYLEVVFKIDEHLRSK